MKEKALMLNQSNQNKKTSKKISLIDSSEEKNRIHQRQFKNFRFQRRVIIPLRDSTSPTKEKDHQKAKKCFEEEKILNQQYNLQCRISSDYVIKNLGNRFQKNLLIWYQEDYNSFLSQFSLENLNFKQRFEIFYCLARGVNDIQQNLVCHRSLSPSTVSIIKINETSIIAKINCFETAITLDNIKSVQSDMNLRPNSFSSPEICHQKMHGLPSDIYSLGCLLNYILYDTIDNIWQEDEETMIEVPQDTPNWLLELLKSMIHYNPSKRYSIGTILQICKSSLKCIDVLGKYIKVGIKNLKLRKISTELHTVSEE